MARAAAGPAASPTSSRASPAARAARRRGEPGVVIAGALGLAGAGRDRSRSRSTRAAATITTAIPVPSSRIRLRESSPDPPADGGTPTRTYPVLVSSALTWWVRVSVLWRASQARPSADDSTTWPPGSATAVASSG